MKSNRMIEVLNKQLLCAMIIYRENTKVKLWYSAIKTSNLSKYDTTDGLHMSDEALETVSIN